MDYIISLFRANNRLADDIRRFNCDNLCTIYVDNVPINATYCLTTFADGMPALYYKLGNVAFGLGFANKTNSYNTLIVTEINKNTARVYINSNNDLRLYSDMKYYNPLIRFTPRAAHLTDCKFIF